MRNYEKHLSLSNALTNFWNNNDFRDLKYILLLLSLVVIGFSARAQSEIATRVVTPYGSFKNPYKEMRSSALIEFMSKTNQFNHLVVEHRARHGRVVRNKDIKSYLKKSGLKLAKNDYLETDKQYQTLEGFLCTFSTVMPLEFNYFNNLKDQSGQKVQIVVFLKGDKHLNNDSRIKATTKIIPMANNYKYKDGQVSDYKVIGVEDNRVEVTLWHGGTSMVRLGNELGDIKYFFNQVHNKESMEHFRISGHGYNESYLADENGTGVQSFKYEDLVKKSIIQYARKNGLKVNDNFTLN